MSQRKLYLALYDVADSGRLASTLALVRNHAYGGQKSAYEVYLSDLEKDELLSVLMMVLYNQADYTARSSFKSLYPWHCSRACRR